MKNILLLAMSTLGREIRVSGYYHKKGILTLEIEPGEKQGAERVHMRKRFKRNGDPMPIQLEQKNGARTIRGYINGMCKDSGKGRRQELLYGTRILKGESLKKKMMAIEAVKEKEPGVVKIMEYYLAMKLLRNRMNHASENEISEEEKEVIRFLKSEQIEIGVQPGQGGMKLDYQKVKALIIEGLELS